MSAQLINVRPQGGGRVRVKEVHTDAFGVQWTYSYPVASEAEANAIMAGRNLLQRLKDRDHTDLLVWVRGLNIIASFDLTNRDITEEEGEDFITTWFATNEGSEAITVAWWIESLNPPSWTAIANRIGYSAEDRSEIQDRAIDLTGAVERFDLIVKTP